MSANPLQAPGETYAIRVKGILPVTWSEWFDGMAICHDEQGNSTLTGAVADQAALFGLLERIRDLGLELLSVTKLT
jgi:hypothetical protein